MTRNLMSLSAYAWLIAVILAFGPMLSAPYANAADHKILARVDGQPVYDWELKLAEDEIGEEVAHVEKQQRRAILLRYVIDTRLMAAAGTKTGIESGKIFRQRLSYSRNKVLRDTFFEQKIRDKITNRELRTAYQAEVKKIKPQQEVRARHILVKREEDALDIIERLNRGDEFVALAKEKSQGPSGRNGGDLGYFPKGQMVKSFELAAFALKPGDISEPVKSSFGWHIIKVEDKRMTPVPTFEDLEGRIRSRLVLKKSRELTEKLRKSAKIEMFEMSGTRKK